MVRRLKQAGIEHLVPQIVVPTETIADHRQGKKTVKRRKLYPGYLMVQMDLSDEVWFALRETPGFGDFVGGHAQPTPARGEDVEKVLAQMDASKDQPKVAVTFKKGDRVKIKTGFGPLFAPFPDRTCSARSRHPARTLVVGGCAQPVRIRRNR